MIMEVLSDDTEGATQGVSSEHEETQIAFHIFSERLKGRRKSVFMMEQLKYLEERLKEKEEECAHLSQEQSQTDCEIQELTAAIFEEANKMIQEATLRRISAEKRLKEAEGEIEVLKEEVAALKKIIINNHPPPKASTALSFLSPPSPTPIGNFIKLHRRAASHNTLNTAASAGGGGGSNNNKDVMAASSIIVAPFSFNAVDGGRKSLFIAWKSRPTLDESDAFISDLLKWDITPCLDFPNKELSGKVYEAILQNQLFVEPLDNFHVHKFELRDVCVFHSIDYLNTIFCSLCQQTTTCEYVVSLHGDKSNTSAISTFARNRVISVCSLVSYLRYITLDIVRLQEDQMYAEILDLLKRMSLTRLGFTE